MPSSTRAVRAFTGVLVAAVFLVVTGGLGQLLVLGLRAGLLGSLAAVGVAVAFATAVGLAPWLAAPALAVAWVAAVGQMAAGLPVVPADAAVLVVLFAAGSSRVRGVRIAGIVSAIVGALAATAYLAAPTIANEARESGVLVGLLLVASLVTLVLAWTFGLLLATLRRARESRAEAAAAEREAIAEQERGRIARDMHDVVAHSLAVIVAQADGARYLEADERSRATLATIATVGREALGDVRVLLERLRHSQGDLPQPGADELGGLIAQVRAAGLDVLDTVRALPPRLPAATDLATYRIVQESLTNALRHGDRSRPVRVVVDGGGGEVRLEIRSALRENAEPGAPGHGLLGMRERARLAGGGFDATTEDAEFVVRASLPAPTGGAA